MFCVLLRWTNVQGNSARNVPCWWLFFLLCSFSWTCVRMYPQSALISQQAAYREHTSSYVECYFSNEVKPWTLQKMILPHILQSLPISGTCSVLCCCDRMLKSERWCTFHLTQNLSVKQPKMCKTSKGGLWARVIARSCHVTKTTTTRSQHSQDASTSKQGSSKKEYLLWHEPQLLNQSQ
jgi:hypothetical protein